MTDTPETPDRPRSSSTVLMENDQVRVSRSDFVPGAETGWHKHDLDYVIVTLTDCPLRQELPGGEVKDVVIAAGQAYTRNAGTEHNVINIGTTAMAFVEIELKSSAD